MSARTANAAGAPGARPATADGAAPGMPGLSSSQATRLERMPALFRFPTVMLLVAVAIGVHIQDLVADSMTREYTQQHYALSAKFGAYWEVELPSLGRNLIPDTGVTWTKGFADAVVCGSLSTAALVILGGMLMLGLLVHRRQHDFLCVAMMAMLLFVDCTQIQPRVVAVGRHVAAGDNVSLGRVPAALRGLRIWHMSQVALLLLIGILQLYSYSVWLGYADGRPEAANKDGDDDKKKKE